MKRYFVACDADMPCPVSFSGAWHAIELASHDIQCNCVAPTYVRTPLTAGIFENEAFLQRVLNSTPNSSFSGTGISWASF